MDTRLSVGIKHGVDYIVIYLSFFKAVRLSAIRSLDPSVVVGAGKNT